MENKFLLELSIEYGLSDEELSKLANIAYQSGFENLNVENAQLALGYVCKMGLVSEPMEQIIEELKLNKLTSD